MYVLFDIGGTNTRIAISKDRNTIGDIVRLQTPQSFNDGYRQLIKNIHTLTNGASITALAGGIAGALNHEKTLLVNSPNLSDWVRKPLNQLLSEELKTKVFLENDAAVAGLGEATYGAGKDFGIVVYVTIGTGVGGARIVEGKIDKSSQGFEPGNQIIDLKGTTLEAYISGEALKRRYGKMASNIDDPGIWDDVAKKLAIGLNNVSVIWSPDIIVLGGSVIKSISLDKVTESLHKILTIFPKAPLVKRAELGDTGGLYGALSIAQTYVRKV